MRIVLTILAIGLILSSCKKDEIIPPLEFGYEYFPNRLGTSLIYEVDSIGHDITSDTAHFQIREVIAAEFVDNEGFLATEIERYRRNISSDPWVLQSVWVQKRTSTTAERVENNERFVRLIFPIEDADEWDGNAYNTMDPWMYSYSGLGESLMVGPFTFNNTVTINQRENINLVDQEFAEEIYSENIGLIYKKLIDLNIQIDGLNGIEWEQSLIDFEITQ